MLRGVVHQHEGLARVGLRDGVQHFHRGIHVVQQPISDLVRVRVRVRVRVKVGVRVRVRVKVRVRVRVSVSVAVPCSRWLARRRAAFPPG